MVLLAFALEQVGIAMPDGAAKLGLPNPSMMTTPKTGLTSILANPSELKIPFEYVNLQEVHQGTNGKLIIHIQDAHANLSGQQNIAHTLNALMSQYDIPLVLSEGGSGNASLGSIRSLMSKKDLLIGSKRLLQENIIAGHEYLNLTSDHDMRIQGIEDMRLYNKNLLAYAALKDSRQAALTYLRQINQSIQRIKNQLYPKEILNYEEGKNRKDNKQNWDHSTQLIELAKSKVIALDEYANIQNLVRIKKSEVQIDFNKVNAEQMHMLDKIPVSELKLIDLSHTSPAAQLDALNKIIVQASAIGIATQSLSEIQKYKKYLSEFAALDFEQLLNDLNKLEKEVYDQYMSNTDLSTLHAIDNHIQLLQKAYRIQLNTADNTELQLGADVFLPAAWQAFLNKQLGQLGFYEDIIAYQDVLDETKEQINAFYDVVNQRDLSFIQNTKEQLNQQNQKAAFLIAGGYHTQHLTQLLKEQNYSYIVLTPIIKEATDHAQYENRLLSSLEVIQKDALSMVLSADASQNAKPRLAEFITKQPRHSAAKIARSIIELQTTTSRMSDPYPIDRNSNTEPTDIKEFDLNFTNREIKELLEGIPGIVKATIYISGSIHRLLVVNEEAEALVDISVSSIQNGQLFLSAGTFKKDRMLSADDEGRKFDDFIALEKQFWERLKGSLIQRKFTRLNGKFAGKNLLAGKISYKTKSYLESNGFNMFPEDNPYDYYMDLFIESHGPSMAQQPLVINREGYESSDLIDRLSLKLTDRELDNLFGHIPGVRSVDIKWSNNKGVISIKLFARDDEGAALFVVRISNAAKESYLTLGDGTFHEDIIKRHMQIDEEHKGEKLRQMHRTFWLALEQILKQRSFDYLKGPAASKPKNRIQYLEAMGFRRHDATVPYMYLPLTEQPRIKRSNREHPQDVLDASTKTTRMSKTSQEIAQPEDPTVWVSGENRLVDNFENDSPGTYAEADEALNALAREAYDKLYKKKVGSLDSESSERDDWKFLKGLINLDLNRSEDPGQYLGREPLILKIHILTQTYLDQLNKLRASDEYVQNVPQIVRDGLRQLNTLILPTLRAKGDSWAHTLPDAEDWMAFQTTYLMNDDLFESRTDTFLHFASIRGLTLRATLWGRHLRRETYQHNEAYEYKKLQFTIGKIIQYLHQHPDADVQTNARLQFALISALIINPGKGENAFERTIRPEEDTDRRTKNFEVLAQPGQKQFDDEYVTKFLKPIIKNYSDGIDEAQILKIIRNTMGYVEQRGLAVPKLYQFPMKNGGYYGVKDIEKVATYNEAWPDDSNASALDAFTAQLESTNFHSHFPDVFIFVAARVYAFLKEHVDYERSRMSQQPDDPTVWVSDENRLVDDFSVDGAEDTSGVALILARLMDEVHLILFPERMIDGPKFLSIEDKWNELREKLIVDSHGDAGDVSRRKDFYKYLTPQKGLLFETDIAASIHVLTQIYLDNIERMYKGQENHEHVPELIRQGLNVINTKVLPSMRKKSNNWAYVLPDAEDWMMFQSSYFMDDALYERRLVKLMNFASIRGIALRAGFWGYHLRGETFVVEGFEKQMLQKAIATLFLRLSSNSLSATERNTLNAILINALVINPMKWPDEIVSNENFLRYYVDIFLKEIFELLGAKISEANVLAIMQRAMTYVEEDLFLIEDAKNYQYKKIFELTDETIRAMVDYLDIHATDEGSSSRRLMSALSVLSAQLSAHDFLKKPYVKDTDPADFIYKQLKNHVGYRARMAKQPDNPKEWVSSENRLEDDFKVNASVTGRTDAHDASNALMEVVYAKLIVDDSNRNLISTPEVKWEALKQKLLEDSYDGGDENRHDYLSNGFQDKNNEDRDPLLRKLHILTQIYLDFISDLRIDSESQDNIPQIIRDGLKSINAKVLPVLRHQGNQWAYAMPDAEDWMVFQTSYEMGDFLYRSRINTLLKFSSIRGLVLKSGLLAWHLRDGVILKSDRTYVGDERDEYEVLQASIGQLILYLNDTNNNNQIERKQVSAALINALIINPSVGGDSIADEANFVKAYVDTFLNEILTSYVDGMGEDAALNIIHDSIAYIEEELFATPAAIDYHYKTHRVFSDDNLRHIVDFNGISESTHPFSALSIFTGQLAGHQYLQSEYSGRNQTRPNDSLVAVEIYKRLKTHIGYKSARMASGELIPFEAGDILMRQGDAGSDVYILDEGVVEVSITETEDEANDEPIILATLTNPNVFGEMAQWYGEERTATVTAITAGAYYAMTAVEWNAFTDEMEDDDQEYFDKDLKDRIKNLSQTEWDINTDFPNIFYDTEAVVDWAGTNKVQRMQWKAEVKDIILEYLKGFGEDQKLADAVLSAYMQSGDYIEVARVYQNHYNLHKSKVRTMIALRGKLFDWSHKGDLNNIMEKISERQNAPWIDELKAAAAYAFDLIEKVSTDSYSFSPDMDLDDVESVIVQRVNETLLMYYQLVNTYADQGLITNEYATLVKGRTFPWIKDFNNTSISSFVEYHKFHNADTIPNFAAIKASRMSKKPRKKKDPKPVNKQLAASIYNAWDMKILAQTIAAKKRDRQPQVDVDMGKAMVKKLLLDNDLARRVANTTEQPMPILKALSTRPETVADSSKRYISIAIAIGRESLADIILDNYELKAVVATLNDLIQGSEFETLLKRYNIRLGSQSVELPRNPNHAFSVTLNLSQELRKKVNEHIIPAYIGGQFNKPAQIQLWFANKTPLYITSEGLHWKDLPLATRLKTIQGFYDAEYARTNSPSAALDFQREQLSEISTQAFLVHGFGIASDNTLSKFDGVYDSVHSNISDRITEEHDVSAVIVSDVAPIELRLAPSHVRRTRYGNQDFRIETYVIPNTKLIRVFEPGGIYRLKEGNSSETEAVSLLAVDVFLESDHGLSAPIGTARANLITGVEPVLEELEIVIKPQWQKLGLGSDVLKLDIYPLLEVKTELRAEIANFPTIFKLMQILLDKAKALGKDDQVINYLQDMIDTAARIRSDEHFSGSLIENDLASQLKASLIQTIINESDLAFTPQESASTPIGKLVAAAGFEDITFQIAWVDIGQTQAPVLAVTATKPARMSDTPKRLILTGEGLPEDIDPTVIARIYMIADQIVNNSTITEGMRRRILKLIGKDPIDILANQLIAHIEQYRRSHPSFYDQAIKFLYAYVPGAYPILSVSSTLNPNVELTDDLINRAAEIIRHFQRRRQALKILTSTVLSTRLRLDETNVNVAGDDDQFDLLMAAFDDMSPAESLAWQDQMDEIFHQNELVIIEELGAKDPSVIPSIQKTNQRRRELLNELRQTRDILFEDYLDAHLEALRENEYEYLEHYAVASYRQYQRFVDKIELLEQQLVESEQTLQANPPTLITRGVLALQSGLNKLLNENPPSSRMSDPPKRLILTGEGLLDDIDPKHIARIYDMAEGVLADGSFVQTLKLGAMKLAQKDPLDLLAQQLLYQIAQYRQTNASFYDGAIKFFNTYDADDYPTVTLAGALDSIHDLITALLQRAAETIKVNQSRRLAVKIIVATIIAPKLSLERADSDAAEDAAFREMLDQFIHTKIEFYPSEVIKMKLGRSEKETELEALQREEKLAYGDYIDAHIESLRENDIEYYDHIAVAKYRIHQRLLSQIAVKKAELSEIENQLAESKSHGLLFMESLMGDFEPKPRLASLELPIATSDMDNTGMQAESIDWVQGILRSKQHAGARIALVTHERAGEDHYRFLDIKEDRVNYRVNGQEQALSLAPTLPRIASIESSRFAKGDLIALPIKVLMYAFGQFLKRLSHTLLPNEQLRFEIMIEEDLDFVDSEAVLKNLNHASGPIQTHVRFFDAIAPAFELEGEDVRRIIIRKKDSLGSVSEFKGAAVFAVNPPQEGNALPLIQIIAGAMEFKLQSLENVGRDDVFSRIMNFRNIFETTPNAKQRSLMHTFSGNPDDIKLIEQASIIARMSINKLFASALLFAKTIALSA